MGFSTKNKKKKKKHNSPSPRADGHFPIRPRCGRVYDQFHSFRARTAGRHRCRPTGARGVAKGREKERRGFRGGGGGGRGARGQLLAMGAGCWALEAQQGALRYVDY